MQLQRVVSLLWIRASLWCKLSVEGATVIFFTFIRADFPETRMLNKRLRSFAWNFWMIDSGLSSQSPTGALLRRALPGGGAQGLLYSTGAGEKQLLMWFSVTLSTIRETQLTLESELLRGLRRSVRTLQRPYSSQATPSATQLVTSAVSAHMLISIFAHAVCCIESLVFVWECVCDSSNIRWLMLLMSRTTVIGKWEDRGGAFQQVNRSATGCLRGTGLAGFP